jgi:hypothetical protein
VRDTMWSMYMLDGQETFGRGPGTLLLSVIFLKRMNDGCTGLNSLSHDGVASRPAEASERVT